MQNNDLELKNDLSENEKELIRAINDGVFRDSTFIGVSIVKNYHAIEKNKDTHTVGEFNGDVTAMHIFEEEHMKPPVLLASFKAYKQSIREAMEEL